MPSLIRESACVSANLRIIQFIPRICMARLSLLLLPPLLFSLPPCIHLQNDFMTVHPSPFLFIFHNYNVENVDDSFDIHKDGVLISMLIT